MGVAQTSYPRRLLAVVGATATGKTELAVALAESISGELISADSRQAIAEMAIGVCKPTPQELHGVPCHGLSWRHLGQPFTAVDFVQRAEPVLAQVWAAGRTPIVVGGTGLYIKALLSGYDFGRVPPAPRDADAGASCPSSTLRSLVAELTELIPDAYRRVDLRNPRRVQRALELARAGAQASQEAPAWSVVQLGCQVDTTELRSRIQRRAERLMGDPLRAEVAGLLAAGYSATTIAGAAIGYAEALAWMAGESSREQAAQAVANRTWRYARAQRTWLRAQPGVVWIDADMDIQGMVAACRPVLQARWGQESV
ncbi:MAG: tRNA (adenosine(37)-N6)-dimethylallyltransferase MiaA [Candidatus Dormibacteraeota bacterium]|nr:tRNA (adenosine(37)-N6)-dimethylallyltransferase MiaA [Candidatus Dormibacteraeota bacterium]